MSLLIPPASHTHILCKLFRVSVCCLQPKIPNGLTVESQGHGSDTLFAGLLCQEGKHEFHIARLLLRKPVQKLFIKEEKKSF